MTAQQPTSTVVVPFKREKSGHITVIARLSGKPVRFIVDTGAGGTCIHSGLIEKYKLSLTSKAKKGGGVGTSTWTMRNVASHNLSLEGTDLSSFKLIALDLTHVVAGLAKAKVEAIVGVLGADVLHRKRAVIEGYRLHTDSSGAVAFSKLITDTGELAASGQVAIDDSFATFDQIVTAEAHRRKGLGRHIMTALSNVSLNRGAKCGVLVATGAGAALYRAMGWSMVSPVTAASFRARILRAQSDA